MTRQIPRRLPWYSLPLLATVFVAACSTPAVSAPGTAASRTGPSAGAALAVQPMTVQVTPDDQATEVRLDQRVSVHTNGLLDEVAVRPATAGAGAPPMNGGMDKAGHAWTASEILAPATRYVVKVSAHAPSGAQEDLITSFTTLAANRLITAATPQDGDTVGVGMPIKLRFNAPVDPDKQANVVKHVLIQTTPAVLGAWHWFSPDEVHWRPATYWPTGTRVNLVANLGGVEVGGGYWGLANWSEAFTIGEAHISTIDNATHMMSVTSNGKPLYTWPVSLGVDNRWPTISGTLVVWYKQQDVLMDSLSLTPPIPHNSPFGYYDHVFWDTAVSTNGFFVHAAPWSVYAQGNSNVSHGCINLSTERATTFFKLSQVGDLVVISGTPRVADAGDGEGDWQIPFAQYPNSQGQAVDTTTSSNPGGV